MALKTICNRRTTFSCSMRLMRRYVAKHSGENIRCQWKNSDYCLDKLSIYFHTTTNVIRHFMEQLFASVSTLGFHFTSGNPISRNTRLVWFYCLFSFVLFTRRWIFFHISRKRLFPKSKGKSLLKRSPVSHFYLLFFYIFYILQTTWVRSRMTPAPASQKKEISYFLRDWLF